MFEKQKLYTQISPSPRSYEASQRVIQPKKQNDAEIQMTLKHALARKLTREKMLQIILQQITDANYKLQLLPFK